MKPFLLKGKCPYCTSALNVGTTKSNVQYVECDSTKLILLNGAEIKGCGKFRRAE